VEMEVDCEGNGDIGALRDGGFVRWIEVCYDRIGGFNGL
jgi:hypothetical protein